MLDPGTLATIAVPVLILMLAGVGWLYRHERERREVVEDQLSEKKYNAYMTLINIFYEVFKATSTGRKPPNDLVTRVIDANKELLIFGSDQVYRDWQAWTLSKTTDDEARLHELANVILQIRRGMGNPNTTLTSDDVLRSLITNYDEHKTASIGGNAPSAAGAVIPVDAPKHEKP